MSRLPGRIVAVMLGTIAVFLLTIGLTAVGLTRALDHQAQENARTQVRVAIENVMLRIRAVNLDYAKWDEAAAAIEARDHRWLFDNIGSAANIGKATQVAVVWGGPFAADFGWIHDGPATPEGSPGLLPPATLEWADRQLGKVQLGTYDGTQFFAWSGDSLYAVAAARIEKGIETGRPPAEDGELARLALGFLIDADQIAAIAQSTLLTGLTAVREEPSGRDVLPLLGGAGEPVAYLVWDAPEPGTELLLELLPILLIVLALSAGLTTFGMLLVRRNAQHLVSAERKASVAARTDVMTGLPNRAAFNEVMAVPARRNERAVLFLDVNDFKRINDSLGHEAGDQVISYVAQRLAQLSGPDCFLARIAGDEFVVVVTGSAAEIRTTWIADLVRHALSAPFNVLNHQIQLSMAMGCAVQADDAMTGSDLVRHADLAMYEAKRHKEMGRLVAYSAVIEQASRDALTIENGLRRALEGCAELSIAYQPIVVASSGRLVRAEALARWTSPKLGSVAPDRFISVAEQSGLIVELGQRLFQLICEDLVAYPELQVSINVSTPQLMAPDFVPNIIGELRKRGIDPGRIELELTEAVLVADSRLAARRIDELRLVGFSLALDDFGTGYSSVGYLEQLRFDTLKIDRSFVSKVRGSADDVAVVDGMIRMAHGLKLNVVCEGIESLEELEVLRKLGSDLAQGYHFDRPLPIDTLAERWFKQSMARIAVA